MGEKNKKYILKDNATLDKNNFRELIVCEMESNTADADSTVYIQNSFLVLLART